MTPTLRHILFLCTSNAIRSQMAQGLAQALASADTQIYSAGLIPSSVHPHAITVLAELNIDISHHISKSIAQVPLHDMDFVIALSPESQQACTYSGITHSFWPIADPYQLNLGINDPLAAFRTVRDQIAEQLQTLLKTSPF